MDMTTTLPYVVLPPSDGVPQSDGALVLLHGYGANAHDLLPLRDALAPGRTAVAFEAPIDLSPMGMPGGRAWFHLTPDPTGGIAYDTEGALAALRQLARDIPTALMDRDLEIEKSVVLGFSQGAMLGHGLLLHEHLPIQGLAACSGRMVPEMFPSDGHMATAIPVHLSHGSLDDLIPITSGQAIRSFYESDTPAHVTWVEEPVGHTIGPDAARSLQAWIADL